MILIFHLITNFVFNDLCNSINSTVVSSQLFNLMNSNYFVNEKRITNGTIFFIRKEEKIQLFPPIIQLHSFYFYYYHFLVTIYNIQVTVWPSKQALNQILLSLYYIFLYIYYFNICLVFVLIIRQSKRIVEETYS